jgi:hypothetical protein
VEAEGGNVIELPDLGIPVLLVIAVFAAIALVYHLVRKK